MSLHTHQSVYREKLIEHLLVGALLKHSWLQDGARLEVSYPAVDRSGHDLVLEVGKVTRHVQLKSSATAGKTASQSVHIDLAKKASGCVIWVQFDAGSMDLESFLFFGNDAGLPLPSLDAFPVLKHTKANAGGEKLLRPGLRVVRKTSFDPIALVSDLYSRLFISVESLGRGSTHGVQQALSALDGYSPSGSFRCSCNAFLTASIRSLHTR